MTKTPPKQQEQQAILDELESIKTLLDEEDLDLHPLEESGQHPLDDDIPLLEEMIFDDDSLELEDSLERTDSPELATPAKPVGDNPKVATNTESHVILEEPEAEPLSVTILDDVQETEITEISADAAESESVEGTTQTQAGETDYLAPGALPGQQSLFTAQVTAQARPADNKDVSRLTEEEFKSTPASTAKAKAAATENPFLPQHIRERLSGNMELPRISEPSFLKEKAGNKPSHKTQPLSDAGTEQVIDSLVAEFMPKIEARLREQLRRKLKKTPNPK